jgi:hypothetical protein
MDDPVRAGCLYNQATVLRGLSASSATAVIGGIPEGTMAAFYSRHFPCQPKFGSGSVWPSRRFLRPTRRDPRRPPAWYNRGMSETPPQYKPAWAQLAFLVVLGFCVGPLALWLTQISPDLVMLGFVWWLVIFSGVTLRKFWLSARQSPGGPRDCPSDSN